MRVDRHDYENGKMMTAVFLTVLAGVDQGDGTAILCDEKLDLGDFHGCKVKGILKVWTESPLRIEADRLRNQLEKSLKTAAIAKAVVRKEVEKQFLEDMESSMSKAAPVQL